MLALSALLLTAPAQAAEPLTLDQALEEALRESADMIVAREDVILVDADYMAALSAVLPRFDVTASAGEFFAGHLVNEQRNPRPTALIMPDQPIDFTVGPFNDFRSNNFSQPQFALSVTGRQLLYDGGRWWTVLAQVDDIEAAREAALESIANDVRLETTRAFYELAKAMSGLDTIQQQIALARAQLERAEALVQAGRGTPRDVATAARNLALDEIEAETRRLAFHQAATQLAVRIGRPPLEPLSIDLPPYVTTSTIVTLRVHEPAALVDVATTYRPALLQLKAQIEAAAKDVDVAAADYWPVVTLEAGYRKNSRRPDRVFGDPSENYTAALDLVMRWNLFEGRATKARVERARVALRKLMAQLDDLARRVAADVQLAIRNLQRQERVYLLSQRGITAAEEALRLARGLYEAGRGTALEVRDAEVGLTNARLTAIDARYEIEVAKEELRRAVGIDLEGAPLK